MPDNYGRYTASERPDLTACLFPRCSYRPSLTRPPLHCPICGLLGAHVGRDYPGRMAAMEGRDA